MSGYRAETRADDPVYVVRTIGRLALMILERRDEYVREPRTTPSRRLIELAALHIQLRALRQAPAGSKEQTGQAGDS